jgi:hypothetical protein
MIRASIIMAVLIFAVVFLIWNTTKNNYDVIRAEIRSALSGGK